MTQTKALQTKTVTFNNVSMLGIQTESGKIFTSVKRICEDLGIDDKGQIQRIKRDETLKNQIEIINIPSKFGNQNTTCINIEFLDYFLKTINIKKTSSYIKNNFNFIYLIDYGFNYYKIGRTENLKKRFKSLNSQSPYDLKLLTSIKTIIHSTDTVTFFTSEVISL